MSDAQQTLSELVAKILDTISVTSWFPAVAVVGGAEFLSELGRADAVTPRSAIAAVMPTTWQEALSFAALVTITTVLLQPFQFSMIRLLEGYWGDGVIDKWFGDSCRDWQRKRRAKVIAAAQQAGAISAEEQDAANMLKALKLAIAQQSDDRGDCEQAGEPALTAATSDSRITANGIALRRFPTHDRVLPTRLGNVMRRGEDDSERLRIEAGPDDIQVAFYEGMHLLPKGLMDQHDLHRSRLDLYCTMWFVFVGLTAFGFVTTADNGWDVLVVGATCLGAAASYWAAIGAADSFGQVLRASSNVIRGLATQPLPRPDEGAAISSDPESDC